MSLLSLLIFIASLVAAGAAFGYSRYISISLESKKSSLAKYQQAYDLPTIQALVRFDSRITEARAIIANHISPSAIFYFLSQQTLENVQFTNFDYSLGSDGLVKVTMSGVAESFSTIALQSDQLAASKMLKDIVFSNITIGEKGKVGFSVSATVDRSLILFSRTVGGATQSEAPADTAPAATQ